MKVEIGKNITTVITIIATMEAMGATMGIIPDQGEEIIRRRGSCRDIIV
jgi:hypothetical protein